MKTITVDNVINSLCENLHKSKEEISLMIGKKVKIPYQKSEHPRAGTRDDYRIIKQSFVSTADFEAATDYHEKRIEGESVSSSWSMLKYENQHLVDFIYPVYKSRRTISFEDIIWDLFNNYLYCIEDIIDGDYNMPYRKRLELKAKVSEAMDRSKGTFDGYTKTAFSNVGPYPQNGFHYPEEFVKKYGYMQKREDVLVSFSEAFNSFFSNKHVLVEVEDLPSEEFIRQKTLGHKKNEAIGAIKAMPSLTKSSEEREAIKKILMEEIEKAFS